MGAATKKTGKKSAGKKTTTKKAGGRKKASAKKKDTTDTSASSGKYTSMPKRAAGASKELPHRQTELIKMLKGKGRQITVYAKSVDGYKTAITSEKGRILTAGPRTSDGELIDNRTVQALYRLGLVEPVKGASGESETYRLSPAGRDRR